MMMLLHFLTWAVGVSCIQPQRFKTLNTTAPNLAITKTGPTQPGYLFFDVDGSGGSNAPVIMTDNNQVIWRGPTVKSPYNFHASVVNGQQVLSYWTGQPTALGGGYGAVHLLDNTYAEIATFCSPKIVTYDVNYQRHPCPFDVHEQYITDRNTLLVTAYNLTTADLTSVGGPVVGYVFDNLFYEIDIATQDVLFRWSALEHLDALPFVHSNLPLGQPNSMNLPWDFFHINTIEPVESGYVINSRYYWEFMLINPDGSVGWRLEGSNGRDFTLDPGIFFSFQHDVRINSNVSGILDVTLFNNDNRIKTGVNESSGIHLSVDLNAMHASLVQNLTDPNDLLKVGAQGSYQSLDNGNALLGYGLVPEIKEFDPSGNVVMNVIISTTTAHSYRAFRQPWTATPYYPPAGVATVNTTSGRTEVYMSWNGATDITSWNIYYGPTRNNIRHRVQVSNQGFETVRRFNARPSFLLVEASRGGQGVRNSTLIQPKVVS